MIRVVSASDAALRALLAGHSRVRLSLEASDGADLEFDQDGWRRRIWIGGRPDRPVGLAELADNNPWVCAHDVSVPTALGTLALVCFGPLARAGLLLEPPTLQTNCPGADSEITEALTSVGWEEGAALSQESFDDDQGVLAATGMALIRNPEAADDLDALYDEAFGRAFFVRRDEESTWDLDLVRNTPRALYRLRYTPGETSSLLTVQAMAARDGKCGAAQLVHAMNVMAGFEESLGTEASAST